MKLRVVPLAEDGIRYLSYSELALFRKCRFRWWLEYVMRVSARQPSAATRLGSLVDAALMARLRVWSIDRGVHADGDTDPIEAIKKACKRNAWPANDRKYGSTEAAAENALHIADRVCDELDIDGDRWQPIAVGGKAAIQITLKTPLDVDPGGSAAKYYTGGFKSKMDWLVADGAYNGRPVANDFKVKAKSMQAAVDLGADLQLALYQHVAEQNSCRILIAQQIQILGKVSKVPRLTAKKRLSTAKKDLVTHDVFMAAIKRLGHPVKWYEEHLEYLKKQRLIQIVPGAAPPSEVSGLWAEAMADAELMGRIALSPPEKWVRGKPSLATRNIDSYAGSQCQSCPLHSLCRATISGRPSPRDAIQHALEQSDES